MLQLFTDVEKHVTCFCGCRLKEKRNSSLLFILFYSFYWCKLILSRRGLNKIQNSVNLFLEENPFLVVLLKFQDLAVSSRFGSWWKLEIAQKKVYLSRDAEQQHQWHGKCDGNTSLQDKKADKRAISAGMNSWTCGWAPHFHRYCRPAFLSFCGCTAYNNLTKLFPCRHHF